MRSHTYRYIYIYIYMGARWRSG